MTNQNNWTKGHTTIYNITQKATDRSTRTQRQIRVNSGAPEGSAIPAQHVAPVVSNDLKLMSEWTSDCCITQIEQLFSNDNKYTLHLIRWWWCPLSTRMTPMWIVIVLVHWKKYINVVPHGHIILNPSLWCFSLILHA